MLHKLFFLFFIPIQLGLAIDTAYASYRKSPPEARKGILDLRKWAFSQNGPLELNGQWEFYWEKLLMPKDFSGQDKTQDSIFIKLPGSWNGYRMHDKVLSGQGYATFRLRIVLPGTEDLALKMLSMSTAYRLFADGRLVSANGKVGRTKVESFPQFLPKTVSLGRVSGKIELVLQISNFYHKKGGAWNPILLGRHKQIISIREKNLLMEIFLYGALLIMSLYHLILYLFRRKELSSLYFAVYCFLIALRTLVKGERFLNELFPDENFELLFKVEYLTFYLAVPVFVNFVSRVFPGIVQAKINRIITILCLAFCALVMVTPSIVYSYSVPFFQLLTLFAIVYVLVNIFRALYKKRQGAFLFLTGSIILFVTVINDILNNQKLIQTGNLVSFGLLIFIFFQAVILSRRFADGMNISEDLSVALEEKVNRRTEKLQEVNLHLQTVINDSSVLVSDIGHKLYNELWPMAQLTTLCREILDDLVSGKQTLEREKLEFMEATVFKSEDSLERIEILKEKIKQNFGRKALKKDVTLKDFVEQALVKMRQILHHRDITLEHKLDLETHDIVLNLNEDQVFTALENIVNNSIQALNDTDSKVVKRILFACKLVDDRVKFSIEDNGQGIPDITSKNIFNMFFSTKQNDGAGGLGLGLPLSKWIIENCHNGTLSVESKLGEYTRFNIYLPVEPFLS